MPQLRIIEDEDLFSAIDARTEALQGIRELGPPDIVYLVKQSGKTTGKQTGVYHHVTGVDASSSASLAAYVNTLIYNSADKTHKVISGLYCCYNAFSNLDLRVEVKIPGSVDSYSVDEKGDKRVASESLWLETFLCGILRAYSYADDGSGDTIKKIVGVRRFNPITTPETEQKFLDAAEQLFFNGRQLGSDPEIQVPNLVCNHLTTGVLKYIKTTGRYASGINLFEKIRTKDVEVSSLLVQVLIAGDEEVQAVRLMHDALEEVPMDYALLDCQAAFCQSKGEGDLALECAKRGVTAAPSEFGTWARLAEVYVSLEQWELALLTLNSCPMFTYQDKDSPRMPEPSRILLPLLPESLLDEIDEGQPKQGEAYDSVHSSLRKLQAATYQGTFLKAYNLLTEMAKSIGWDRLLRTRSQVFVMEEEYRTERQSASASKPSSNRNASVAGLSGTPNGATGEGANVGGDESDSGGEGDEDGVGDGDKDKDAARDTHRDEDDAETLTEQDQPGFVGRSTLPSRKKSMHKPEPTMTPEVVKSGNEDPDAPHSGYSQFQNKRLCERWLDSLFMGLYEDLRIYTIWRTEMAQYRQQQIQYKKSATEWEILGELAERLHHFPEAVEAYQQCLAIRFSPLAMKGILKLCEREGDSRGMLSALIRLICWQYRWYSEVSRWLCPNRIKTNHSPSSRRSCSTPSVSSLKQRGR
jgi:Chs5-Arf1p-binding protein BUD7/BCH1